MKKTSFAKSGHLPTLVSAFLYFDISFMVWVLFGPLTPFIAEQMHLSATQKGLLTAVPLLGGSFFRPILGLLADRFGGRRVGILGLSLTLVPLILGWHFASQLWQLYIVGFLLGIAGASFAVALPLAGRWYPPEHQGLAMGIAGAGNSGTLVATLFGPRLAQHYGWHVVFAMALLPICAVLAVFFLLARNSPSKAAPKPWSSYGTLLRTADTWRFCLLYSLTFGGFVGMTSFLSVFFHDQYHLSKIAAGDLTTIVVLSGSFLRPVGGWLSDKAGGFRMLLGLFGAVALCLLLVCTLPPVMVVVPLLFVVMGMLGMGNGAVFQMVPQRFPVEIEIVTGIVGAAGGLGGFFLPSLLGMLKDLTGTYAAGIACFAFCTATICMLLLEFGIRWKRSWPAGAIARARVFSYRATGTKERIGEVAAD
ncbi:nitrate/nitrite transporter [Occallatibacter riparius]|uniref:NarK/NasA family nitrate transporter n=1 Tax=Occallatibacter riparius TaxID=1002689 RepID=A0A9J7BVL3_9BACT|nr:nitrate/nitrite transporter [Occallatibacter riparius]UWZ86908.1 NarK/NasA family nitrate transporter [Occallatibacter riparius]